MHSGSYMSTQSRRMSSPATIAILHNIRSIHNVASMFRTADGAGIEKICLTGITPGPRDVFDRPIDAFKKVSLGAEESVKWEKIKSIGSAIKRLQKEGYQVVAIEQDKKSIPLKNFKRKNKKIALLMGEETKGLTKVILGKCDAILEIPMRGKKESLNVSVAFGIAAYEINS
jgi:23S rRNA (guanosine2251-2'-O)-methyltransferase